MCLRPNTQIKQMRIFVHKTALMSTLSLSPFLSPKKHQTWSDPFASGRRGAVYIDDYLCCMSEMPYYPHSLQVTAATVAVKKQEENRRNSF